MNKFTSQPVFPWSQMNSLPPQSFWFNLAAMMESGTYPSFGSSSVNVPSITPNSRSELFSQQMSSQSSTGLQNVNFNSSPSNLNQNILSPSNIDNANSSDESLNLSAVSNSSGEASSNCITNQPNQREEMIDVIVDEDNLMEIKRYEVTPTTRMPTWLARDDLDPSMWNLDTSRFPFEEYAGKLKEWAYGESDLFTCDWTRFSRKTCKLMDKYNVKLSKYYRTGINSTIRRQFCGVVGDRFPKLGDRYFQFRKLYSRKVKLGATARMQSFKILVSATKTSFKSRNIADFLFYKLEQQVRYVKVSQKSTKPAKEIMKKGTSLAVGERNKRRKQTQDENEPSEDSGDGGLPIGSNEFVYPGEHEGDAVDSLEFDAVIVEEDDETNYDDEDKENNPSEI